MEESSSSNGQEENVALRQEKTELLQKLQNLSRENKELLDTVLDLQAREKFLTESGSLLASSTVVT
ncbi:hypothetical protein JOB18_008230 [Solea senegalensis]|nr:hypothetical protein JOB18_008230 [Solea senegalensis]